MPQPEIQTLNHAQPDDLVYAAARLLVSQVHTAAHKSPQAYLDSYYPDRDTLYALTQTDTGLLAASFVRHGHSTEVTYVHAIAVDESARREGHGRTLMQHIARRAIESGDSVVSLVPLNEVFFTSLGFKHSQRYMVANPRDLLDK